MGCLSAIFVRSDDSRDCHNIHGRKYLGNTDRNLVGTQAHTVNISINYIDAASLDALTHTLPKFTRRSATEGPMPCTTELSSLAFIRKTRLLETNGLLQRSWIASTLTHTSGVVWTVLLYPTPHP